MRSSASRPVMTLSAFFLGFVLADPAFAGDFGCGGVCFNTLGQAETNCANTVLVKAGSYTLNNVVNWDGTKTVRVGDSTCTNVVNGSAAAFTAASNKRAFVVDAGAALTMIDISLAGGAPNSGNAGGNIIVNTGSTLHMSNGTLSNGTTIAANGGCLAGGPDSTVTLSEVTVDGCTADGEGGGISIVGLGRGRN